MKRLSVNEREVLARLADADGEPRTPHQLRDDDGPAVFFIERYCERLADRGLADRLEHGYGRGPRAYAITRRGAHAIDRMAALA